MPLWFKDLMSVTEEVTIRRPNVLTLLSGAFIRSDLNAATRDPLVVLLNPLNPKNDQESCCNDQESCFHRCWVYEL